MAISTVRGAFSKVTGSVVFDDKDISKSTVDVSIDANSVDTRVPDRDNDLRSDKFFDVAHHPSITFKSKRSLPANSRSPATSPSAARPRKLFSTLRARQLP